MVNQNYVLYVNEKNTLRSESISLTVANNKHNIAFKILEKHLICGLILKGIPVKGDRLKDFPFKPIEKYLFEFSNIHFVLPQMEFSQENTDYSFQIDSLENILLPIEIAYIVAYEPGNQSGTVQGKLHFNMSMPATGLYEVQETYDDGINWYPLFFFSSADENLEIPGSPGNYAIDKLLGSSSYPNANNSLIVNFYENQIRIVKNGVVISQSNFSIG